MQSRIELMVHTMTKQPRRRYAAEHKFARIAALNSDIEVGGHIGMAARKDKRKMADTWVKRERSNPGDLHKRSEARAAKRAPITITRML